MNIMTVYGNVFGVFIIMLIISLIGWIYNRNSDNDDVIKVFVVFSVIFGLGTVIMTILVGLQIISIQ